ncbi:TPA: glutamine amidotransferase [Candidatus Saccharibacteria bacterium]|nr:glutamine amidotransferase [Candidatus Saccharibacteria bacterium]HRK40750.1 glutamine amidotransferase [Candidatus Saccharibacteria bacterium]
MSKGALRVLHLYPREMNIYGDWGNVLTIIRRAEWHGYAAELVQHHPGKPFPSDIDIVIGGGGQDSGQGVVKDDLLTIGSKLHKLADDDVPMLMICGLYQLFGRFFKTASGDEIPGIGIFKTETHAGPTRLIGNVVTKTPFGELVGYENHSGLTMLDDGQPALGSIVKGAGNNGQDRTEGAIYRCVFGSYLHGSLLPKNPAFADALIEAAAHRKFGSFEPAIIDDRFADLARGIAKKRPR